jgi:flavin reductase (DIM6/NTAB) family NADH-FMN oxidoreductase RutF
MISIDPATLPIPKLHQYLLGSIGPRPICFASTIDKAGNRNLSPFSFFNVFSANPPILVFSPARSGRTGETKNTHDNCKEVPEVVVNVVSYNIVQQMSLSSSPYAKGVDEFVKAGFTPLASEVVKPYRVAESPIQFECKVLEIKELGEKGGAGNLIICEVVKMHFDEQILDQEGMVDQQKIDLVARMGRNWYCRAHGESLFEIPKPLTSIGIGIDALPDAIKKSNWLTGNQLGKLGGVETMPSDLDAFATCTKEELKEMVSKLLDDNKNEEALGCLLKNLNV